MSQSAATNTPGDHLSALVRSVSQRTKRTLPAIAAEAIDPETGQQLGQAYVYELARNKIPRAPEMWRLRALAAGLRVPLAEVQRRTSAQFIGYVAEEFDYGSGAYAIYALAAQLPPEDQEALRAVGERFVERFRQIEQDNEGSDNT